MKQIKKILNTYFQLYAWVCYLVLAVVIIMVVCDVMLRWLFRKPFPDTIEMIRFFLPMITFLPLAYTLRMKKHINVTAVTDRLPTTAQKIVLAIAYGLGAVTLVLISIGAWRYYLQSYAYLELASGAVWWIPLYICKFCIFLGDISMIIAYLLEMVDLFTEEKEQTA